MPNFDGVWELRTFYTTTPSSALAMQHKMTFDVNVTSDPVPGTDAGDITIRGRDGTMFQLDTWFLTTWMPLIQACYNTGGEFVFAELWKIPESTFDGVFITTFEIGLAGTNAGALTVAQQTTFTFRSELGGGGRIQLMESSFSGNARQSPPFSSVAGNNLSNYVKSLPCPILARDNGAFIARIAQCDGQNEKLARKRFRS